MGFYAGLRPILHQRMPKHSSSHWALIDFLYVCLGACVCIFCFIFIFILFYFFICTLCTIIYNNNSDMATKTGSSYITGTITDSVEIPTASSGFSTIASPNKVSPTDCDNDRQPEMATWPPKPEILTSPALWQIGWQFQRQIWGEARRNCKTNKVISASGNSAAILDF